jgi:hypothetical protein
VGSRPPTSSGAARAGPRRRRAGKWASEKSRSGITRLDSDGTAAAKAIGCSQSPTGESRRLAGVDSAGDTDARREHGERLLGSSLAQRFMVFFLEHNRHILFGSHSAARLGVEIFRATEMTVCGRAVLRYREIHELASSRFLCSLE